MADTKWWEPLAKSPTVRGAIKGLAGGLGFGAGPASAVGKAYGSARARATVPLINAASKGWNAPLTSDIKAPPGSGGRGGSFDRQTKEAPRRPAQDNTQYTKQIQDFLDQSRALLNSGSSASISAAINNIANREAAIKSQGATADSNIGKGYAALQSFIAGQADPIQQNFQTAVDGTGAAADTAKTSMIEASEAANAQRQAILNRLGTADSEAVLLNKGIHGSGDLEKNIADVAGRAQAAQTRLESNKQTALNYNTQFGSSSALQGRAAQDGVQRTVTNAIAALQDERAAAQASAQVDDADVWGLAQQMLNSDQGIWEGNYNRRYQVEGDAAANALSLYEAQQKSGGEPMDSTSYGALGPVNQAVYALQQSGVDPQQASVIAQAVSQEYAANGGKMDVSKFITAVQKNLGASASPLDVSTAVSIFYKYFQ